MLQTCLKQRQPLSLVSELQMVLPRVDPESNLNLDFIARDDAVDCIWQLLQRYPKGQAQFARRDGTYDESGAQLTGDPNGPFIVDWRTPLMHNRWLDWWLSEDPAIILRSDTEPQVLTILNRKSPAVGAVRYMIGHSRSRTIHRAMYDIGIRKLVHRTSSVLMDKNPWPWLTAESPVPDTAGFYDTVTSLSERP